MQLIEASGLMEVSLDKSFEERQVLAFEKLPLGVVVIEAVKNKRCLRGAIGRPEFVCFSRKSEHSGNFSSA